MTVANPYSPNIYTASGSQADFAFTFQIISDTNAVPDITTVEVQLNGVVQSSGFTTVANQDQQDSPGGTVTFNSDPTVGTIVTLSRKTPVTQVLDFPLAAKFSTAALEVAFDKTCMEVQENEYLLETSAQAQQAPVAYAIPQANPTMSGFDWVEPVQAGNVILDGGVGNPFVSGPVTSAAGGNVVAPGGGATIGHLASYAATNGQTLADSGISVVSITAQIAAAIAALYTTFNNVRVYLVTGQPYADGSNSGNSTLYAGPLPTGNKLTVDDGLGNLSIVTLTEVSLALTLTANSAYSVFLVNTAGVQTLEVDVWSNTTTPLTYAADGAGRRCKSGATNKLLIAEVQTNATANKLFDWASTRNIINMFNKMPASLTATDASGNWAGTGSIESSHGNTTDGVGRVSFFVGSDPMQLVANAFQGATSVATDIVNVGIGVNSTSAFTVKAVFDFSAAGGGQSTGTITVALVLTTGPQYIQRLDNAPGTSTLVGSAGQNGLSTLINK